MTFKKIVVITIALILAGIIFAANAILPSRVQSALETAFRANNFARPVIGEISVHPNGFAAKNITLDEGGFDKIETLEAKVNWFTYLLNGRGIHDLTIRGMKISRDTKTLTFGAGHLLEKLKNLNNFRLTLTGVTLDVSTLFGAIRMNMDVNIEPKKGSDAHEIKAAITANQFQLGFNSQWQGTISKHGGLDLSGNFSDGRIDFGALRISRSNGWATFAASGADYSFQNQFEAGSAEFMGVPLQSVTMVNDFSAAKSTSITRAGVSGMPDVLFMADYIREGDKPTMTTLLRGKNFGGLLDLAEESTKRNKDVDETLLALRDFTLTANYEHEKRFEAGPLPFGISMQSSGNRALNGNLLFYPDTYELRGSLEISESLTNAFENYFQIPKENMNGNFIRLDGDAKKIFALGKENKN